MLFFAESRREEREEGRNGVVGRERGLREAEVDLLALLVLAWGVVEAIAILDSLIDEFWGVKARAVLI